MLDGMEEYLSEEDAVEVSAAMGSHDVVPTVLQKAFDLVDDFAYEMDELAMSHWSERAHSPWDRAKFAGRDHSRTCLKRSDLRRRCGYASWGSL